MYRELIIMSYTKLSKYMSLILRHKPQVIGITLDEHGWADVNELIAGIAKHNMFNREILEEIVRTDAKGRYSFNADRTKIRANQGHSIPVNLELVGPVLEGVALGVDGAGELAGLAGGDESAAEAVCDGRTDEEATSLRAHDLGDAPSLEVTGDVVDDGAQRLGVVEERRDVLEDDARLGVVGDVDDAAREVEV